MAKIHGHQSLRHLFSQLSPLLKLPIISQVKENQINKLLLLHKLSFVTQSCLWHFHGVDKMCYPSL